MVKFIRGKRLIFGAVLVMVLCSVIGLTWFLTTRAATITVTKRTGPDFEKT